MTGQTIIIRNHGDDDSFPSSGVSIEIPARRDAPKVEVDSNGNLNTNTPGSKLSLLNRKDHIAYIAGRTTTQAAPNADITRAEVAAILYRLLTPEAKSAQHQPLQGCPRQPFQRHLRQLGAEVHQSGGGGRSGPRLHGW